MCYLLKRGFSNLWRADIDIFHTTAGTRKPWDEVGRQITRINNFSNHVCWSSEMRMPGVPSWSALISLMKSYHSLDPVKTHVKQQVLMSVWADETYILICGCSCFLRQHGKMFVWVHSNESDWQITAPTTITIYFKLNKHDVTSSRKGSQRLMDILDEGSPKILLFRFPQDTFRM